MEDRFTRILGSRKLEGSDNTYLCFIESNWVSSLARQVNKDEDGRLKYGHTNYQGYAVTKGEPRVREIRSRIQGEEGYVQCTMTGEPVGLLENLVADEKGSPLITHLHALLYNPMYNVFDVNLPPNVKPLEVRFTYDFWAKIIRETNNYTALCAQAESMFGDWGNTTPDPLSTLLDGISLTS